MRRCFAIRRCRDRYADGSVTVEASLGLFLFLMFFVCILYFYQVLNLEVNMQSALDNTAQLQAAYCAAGNLSEGKISLAGCQLNSAFAMLYTEKQLNTKYLNASWIKGGSDGLDFSESEFLTEDNCIDVKVKYRISIPFFKGITFYICQHAKRRIWVGDDSSLLTDASKTVYIVPGGEVYHLFSDCSYIKITPIAVAGNKIELIRNESGACYYPCEWCDPSADGTVYITTYGTRYHSSASCSAIERDVQTISLDEVGSRRLCSKCAKRNQNTGE